jgi:alpha-N-acetylglucosamine transferase
MSNWMPMERIYGTYSSWTHSPLDNDDSTTSKTSWKDTSRNLVGIRGLRRVLLALLLIIVFANRFPLRAHRGSAPLDNIDPEQFPEGVDWSQYAYCQYVTNPQYLCNSVMIFEALDRVGAKASKVMMFPSNWDITNDDDTGRLIRHAQARYNVQLSPNQVQHLSGETTWADSLTKLLAFNQTYFKRVLSLDSDATVLKNMDELFLLPSAPVAMPRAYWLDNTLSSQLVLVEPSEFEFQRILKAFDSRSGKDYDMEIVNNLYGSDCMVIPHRKYDLLTGEFQAKEHRKYLGSEEETWDPRKALDEAKFVHFSDWSLPKPWLLRNQAQVAPFQPECHPTDVGEDCRDREIWLSLYADFAQRRKICDVTVKYAA